MFDLYRWMDTAALTSRDQELIAAVTALATSEDHPRKLAILRESLQRR
jgi:hypothetical protein